MCSQSRSSRNAPPRPHGAAALILPWGPSRWGCGFLPSVVSELGQESVSRLACSGGGLRTHLRLGPLPEARDRKLSGISGVPWRKYRLPHWWRLEQAVGRRTGCLVSPQLGARFRRSTTAPSSSPDPGAAARGAPSGSLTPLQGASTWASPGPPAGGLAPGFSTPGHCKKCPYQPAPCPPPWAIETLVQSDSLGPGTRRIQDAKPWPPTDGALHRLWYVTHHLPQGQQSATTARDF